MKVNLKVGQCGNFGGVLAGWSRRDGCIYAEVSHYVLVSVSKVFTDMFYISTRLHEIVEVDGGNHSERCIAHSKSFNFAVRGKMITNGYLNLIACRHRKRKNEKA